MKISKKKKEVKEKLDCSKTYSIEEGLGFLEALPKAKFNESIDVNIILGIDVRKSDQMVRGSVVLPNGIGKQTVVCVFCEPDAEQAAKDAGADIVGLEDLVEKLQKDQKIDFDIAVAHPSVMPKLTKVARILGSKGMMPNPKNGTLTTDIPAAVKNAKMGQVNYRADKFGIIHASVGRMDFKKDHLKENITALIGALKKSKPPAAKGVYLKKIYIAATMGPSLKIDINSLTV